MEIFLRALALVGEPPGSLVYHLVVLFALEGAAAIAISQWWRGRGAVLGRLALAAGAIFLLRLVVLVVAFLAAATLLNPLLTLPPLDRAASAVTVLLIIWIFAFPEPARLVDALVAGLGLLTLLALGITWGLWAQEVAAGATFFNGTLQETTWDIGLTALLGVGLLLLLLRRKSEWLIGVVLLALLLGSHIFHLVSPIIEGTSFLGAVRLAEIVALPLLAAMVYRRAHWPALVPAAEFPSVDEDLPTTAPLPEEPPAPESARPKWAVDPKALVPLASLNAARGSDEVGRTLTLAMAQTFRADLCLLVTPPDGSGAASVACAYDLIREKHLAGFVLPLHDMRTVDDALRRIQPALLTMTEHAPELRQLAAALGLDNAGPALLVPLASDTDGLLGALVLLSPYSQREWTPDDRALLASLVEPIAGTLQSTQALGRLRRDLDAQRERAASAEHELNAARAAASQAADDLHQVRSEALRLAEELTQLRAEIAAGQLDTVVGAKGPAGAPRVELEGQLSQLQAQLETAQLAVEERDGLLLELEAARDRLEQLEETAARLAMAEREADEQEARAAKLEAELEQARAEGASGQEDLETARQLAEEHARLEAELMEANDRLATHVLLEARLEAATRDVEEWQQRERELRVELEHAREEWKAANALAVAGAPQAEALERMRAELQAERDQLEAELTAAKGELQAQAILEAQLAAARREAEVYRQRAEEVEAEVERAHTGVEQARAELDAAAANAQEVARLRTELERAQHQAADRDRLEAELQEALKRLAAQGAIETRLKAVARDFEEHQRRERELEAELERARAAAAEHQAAAPKLKEIETLRAAVQAAQKQAEERQRLETELRAARQTLEAHKEAEGKLQFEVEAQQQQEAQLRKELELTRAELRRRTEQAAELAPQPEAPGTAEERAQLQQDLAGKSAALAAAQAALSNAKNELAGQAKSVAVMRELLTKKERLLAEVQGKLANAATHALEPTEWQQQLAEKERQLAEAQAKLAEAAQSPDADLAARLAEKERFLAEAQAALAVMSKQSKTLVAIQAQLAEKERQLAEAHAALQQLQRAHAAEAASADGSRVLIAQNSPTMEVIASMAQDLRQPMSSIVGYSDLLLGESVGILGALQRKFLERIVASCERMQAGLDDLIRVLAIDTGRLKLSHDTVDVMNVVEEAMLNCAAQFREKSINLRLHIADDLPPVRGDRDALREIITHLLNNAGDASAIDGEVVLGVQRETERQPMGEPINYLLVSVRDSGGGIAQDDVPRVFSRFYRADAPLIAGLGDTGVGLSLAKALVEAQGGRIWLNSEIGVGTTINLLLPVESNELKSGDNGAAPPSPD